MSSTPYSTFCDEFYINMRLGSQLPLPNGRETVLHFYEQVQKAFPGMTRFRRTGDDHKDFSLEEERSAGQYRWVNLEHTRLSSGHVNPPDVASALKLHQHVLDLAPHALGLSPVEVDYVDLLFGFDLEYAGNHDEIVAEGLFENSPLSSLLEIDGARAIDFQPSTTIALSDDLRLQARIDIVTRTSSYQVRTGDYGDESISVYLILRRFWGDRPKKSVAAMIPELAERAQELAQSHVLPRIVRPISTAIASRS
ncbi:MAG: hypothetical protein QM770_20270 [Tepidisphaeraceae bacterium]